ncbi:hypothetical protein FACS1894166_12180 [Bacilli bacterium]|nr:hypothetical protein FACS1894166_12180 [Bacilli bacterium]
MVSINDQYDNIQNYGQLNIPSNVTSIGEMLLYNYTYTNKITSIRFQSFNNIRSFGMGCFDMAHVTGFYFGNSTTPANHLDFRDQVIGDYAFAYMAKYQQTNNIITLNFTGNCQVGNGAFYQFDSNEGSSTTCVSTIMIGNTGNTFGYGVFPTMMQGRPNLVIQLDSSCGYQKTTMGSG